MRLRECVELFALFFFPQRLLWSFVIIDPFRQLANGKGIDDPLVARDSPYAFVLLILLFLIRSNKIEAGVAEMPRDVRSKTTAERKNLGSFIDDRRISDPAVKDCFLKCLGGKQG